LEGRFDRYLDAMMPLLVAGMQNSEEYSVCTAAVGALGDLCRAVEAKVKKIKKQERDRERSVENFVLS
jgi:hypothetical protein